MDGEWKGRQNHVDLPPALSELLLVVASGSWTVGNGERRPSARRQVHGTHGGQFRNSQPFLSSTVMFPVVVRPSATVCTMHT